MCVDGVGAGRNRRRRHGRYRRGAAGCRGGSAQPGADRAGEVRHHRRPGAVPDRGPAPGHLHGHLRAGWVQYGAARRDHPREQLRRQDRCRAQSRVARGDDHGDGRSAGRGCPEFAAQGSADDRRARGPADRPDLRHRGQGGPGCRRAGGRRRGGALPRVSRGRLRLRGARRTDLGGRHEPVARAGQRHTDGALPQPRCRAGVRLPDQRRLGRVPDGRRADQHDPEDGRQSVLRPGRGHLLEPLDAE